MDSYRIEEINLKLRSTFWHEIGHLVVDITLQEEIYGVSIDKFEIYYFSGIKTGGGVFIGRDNKKFYIDFDSFYDVTIYLITLISGCLFQTFYLKSINKENYTFDKCFNKFQPAGGVVDYNKFESLIQLQAVIKDKESYRDFIKNDIRNFIENELKTNTIFYDGINKIISLYIHKIWEYYGNKIKADEEFKFIIRGDELEILIEEINYVLIESGFKKVIGDSIRKIIEKFP